MFIFQLQGGQPIQLSCVLLGYGAGVEDLSLFELVGHVQAETNAKHLLANGGRPFTFRVQLLDYPDLSARRRDIPLFGDKGKE